MLHHQISDSEGSTPPSPRVDKEGRQVTLSRSASSSLIEHGGFPYPPFVSLLSFVFPSYFLSLCLSFGSPFFPSHSPRFLSPVLFGRFLFISVCGGGLLILFPLHIGITPKKLFSSRSRRRKEKLTTVSTVYSHPYANTHSRMHIH